MEAKSKYRLNFVLAFVFSPLKVDYLNNWAHELLLITLYFNKLIFKLQNVLFYFIGRLKYCCRIPGCLI